MTELAGASCLVTGASGFLGSWVVEKLVARGARVRCLVRRTSKRTFLGGPGIELAIGDVTDLASLRTAVPDVDYVFHLAGLIKTPRPTEYFRINYLGTINLLEACRAQADRLRRVVVVTSQAAAGPSRPGRPLDESMPGQPITPYGKSKLLAEQAAGAYVRHFPLTVVRPPTIYGPRDRETFLMFRLAALGLRPVLLVDGAISSVHVADLVDGIFLAATHPRAVGATYFLTGDETPPPGQMMALIADAVGGRQIPVPIPTWAIRGAGRLAEAARDVTGIPFIFDRWKAEELAVGYWACSNARARAEIGFAPRVPLADGLKATTAWYREAGWL